MSNFDIKQHGVNVCAYYQLKEASMANLGAVWVQLCNILETLFLETVKKIINACYVLVRKEFVVQEGF